MALYDRIGKTYRSTRIPDLRIAQALLDALGLEPESKIADIGAGTGGYSNLLADQGYAAGFDGLFCRGLGLWLQVYGLWQRIWKLGSGRSVGGRCAI